LGIEPRKGKESFSHRGHRELIFLAAEDTESTEKNKKENQMATNKDFRKAVELIDKSGSSFIILHNEPYII